MTASSPFPAAEAPGAWKPALVMALLFGPAAAWVVLRWVLDFLASAGADMEALALHPVGTTTGWLQALWPFMLGAGVLALLVVLTWRWGLSRMAPLLSACWLLLWFAGCAMQVVRYLDPRSLEPLAPESVVVLARAQRPPSTRSLGGVELVVRRVPPAVPHRLLVDPAAAADLAVGERLELQLAQGRFGGLYVRQWRRLGQGGTAATPSR